ncbi:MAG: radical SAM protein [Candidatus Omnitrophica bacterium]|nr:radical SAM protein [Candidatus Omnitrophota bacterium]
MQNRESVLSKAKHEQQSMDSIKFLTKNKLDDYFLAEVIDQLKHDKDDKRYAQEVGILNEIICNLEDNVEFSGDKSRFVVLPNEYNFLSQNNKFLWAEYLIFRYKFRIYPKFGRLPDFPIHLLIEPVSYCNIKCSMCFQTDADFTKPPYMGNMDIGLFRSIIDEAVENKCRALTLASRGEPTLHPNFAEVINYARGKFFDFKLNTNAVSLDEKKCHQILQGEVTELVFSVNAVNKNEYQQVCKIDKFEQVVNNIKQFHRIRNKDYPESKCKTRVNGVEYGPDFSEEQFLNFWDKIVDNVVCLKVFKRWDTYNNILSSVSSPCALLWQRIYVWFDGTASPCDRDYKSLLKIGNIRESSVKSIWNGEKMNLLRKKHKEGFRSCFFPCDRCED